MGAAPFVRCIGGRRAPAPPRPWPGERAPRCCRAPKPGAQTTQPPRAATRTPPIPAAAAPRTPKPAAPRAPATLPNSTIAVVRGHAKRPRRPAPSPARPGASRAGRAAPCGPQRPRWRAAPLQTGARAPAHALPCQALPRPPLHSPSTLRLPSCARVSPCRLPPASPCRKAAAGGPARPLGRAAGRPPNNPFTLGPPPPRPPGRSNCPAAPARPQLLARAPLPRAHAAAPRRAAPRFDPLQSCLPQPRCARALRRCTCNWPRTETLPRNGSTQRRTRPGAPKHAGPGPLPGPQHHPAPCPPTTPPHRPRGACPPTSPHPSSAAAAAAAAGPSRVGGGAARRAERAPSPPTTALLCTSCIPAPPPRPPRARPP
jgi:hypothetical protein